MTFDQYVRRSKRLSEEIQNFTGTPEESAKFFEGLSKKYPDVIEFNARAAKCKDIGEFKTLADSFGLVFSSDESAERLFSLLLDGTKRIEKLVEEMKNGAELSDEVLESVDGGKGSFWGLLAIDVPYDSGIMMGRVREDVSTAFIAACALAKIDGGGAHTAGID